MECVMIVDGHHGIYVPQVWALRYGEQVLSAGVAREDYEVLLVGPDHASYWDAWSDVLDSYCHVVNGTKYYLYQSEDLWEYQEGYRVSDDGLVWDD